MKVPWFALAVLLASVFLGVLFVRENFVVSAADKAEMDAKLAARSATYGSGDVNSPTSRTAGYATLLKTFQAACDSQTAACAPVGTTQACCNEANQLCTTATTNATNYTTNTPAANKTAAAQAALDAEKKRRCDAATAACTVPTGKTDTACCAVTKPYCTEATAAVVAAQNGTSFTAATTYADGTKIAAGGTGPLVGQAGNLGVGDAAAKSFGETLLKNLDLTGVTGAGSTAAVPATGTAATGTTGAGATAAAGTAAAAGAIGTQTSLSTASASLTSNLPTVASLLQGVNYNAAKTTNGNTAPTATATYSDCGDYSTNPVAVQVGRPYPFPTGSDDNGCACD
jgi:hypothetical protein